MGGDKCGADGRAGWGLGKQHRHARSLPEIPADGDESHNNRLVPIQMRGTRPPPPAPVMISSHPIITSREMLPDPARMHSAGNEIRHSCCRPSMLQLYF
jgi:hypothetical protein